MNPESNDDQTRLDQLAEEFMELRRAGEDVSIDDFAEKYPEWSEEIHTVFQSLEVDDPSIDSAPEEAEPAVNPTWPVLSDYRIFREVARGGMGIVYEAEQLSLGRRVALKTLAHDRDLGPNAEKRFQSEARSAAGLHHTNIVPVYEVGHENGVSFYAMQFINGQGLDQVISQVGKLLGSQGKSSKRDSGDDAAQNSLVDLLAQSMLIGNQTITGDDYRDRFQTVVAASEVTPAAGVTAVDHTKNSSAEMESSSHDGSASETAPIANAGQSTIVSSGAHRKYCQSVAKMGRQTASGLDYAHQKGVIHRDIKPSNLLLDVNGTIWITDLGLAKTDDSNLTKTGDVVGTLRYMSPERFDGECDERSDIYALGMTLYEMLALRPAFKASGNLSLLDKIRDEQPEPLRKIDPRIPGDLTTIVAKAIEKNPDNRYASAGELHDDLDRFIENRPIKAKQISPLGHLARWAQRNRIVASLLGVMAIGLVMLTAVSLYAANTYRNKAIAEQQRADKEAELAQLEKDRAIKEAQLKLQEQQARSVAEGVRDFMVDSFRSPDPHQDGRTITVYEVLTREVGEIPDRFHDDPLTEAALLKAIGESFEALGLLDEAIETLQRALASYEEAAGPEAKDTIHTMASLVNAYCSNGQGDLAIPLAERARELTLEHHMNDQEFWLSNENNVAAAYYVAGQDARAIEIFELVLETARKSMGDDDEKTLGIISTLADAYTWVRRDDEAAELFEEHYRRTVEKYGEESLEAAESKYGLANVVKQTQGQEAALTMQQDAYEIMARELGEDHYKTLQLMESIGNSLVQLGRVEEGLQMQERQFDLSVKKYGRKNQLSVSSATSLALAHLENDDHDEAIRWLQEAVSIGEELMGKQHPMVLNSIIGMASTFKMAGELEKSLAKYQQVYDVGQPVHGLDQQDVRVALGNIAALNLELHSYVEAEKYARIWVELADSLEPPSPIDSVQSHAALAGALLDQDQIDAALEQATIAVDAAPASQSDSVVVLRPVMIRGIAIARNGELEEGMRIFEPAFKNFKSQLSKLTPFYSWNLPRACERAIELYRNLDRQSEVDRWTTELEEINRAIAESMKTRS